MGSYLLFLHVRMYCSVLYECDKHQEVLEMITGFVRVGSQVDHDSQKIIIHLLAVTQGSQLYTVKNTVVRGRRLERD